MSTTQTSRDFPAALLGPSIWAGHFMLVYALEAVLCTTPGPSTDTVVRIAGMLLTGAALTTLLALLVWQRRRSRAVIAHHLAISGPFITPLTLLSILAIAWTSLPLFTLPACTST
jgi:hypothetical protein